MDTKNIKEKVESIQKKALELELLENDENLLFEKLNSLSIEKVNYFLENDYNILDDDKYGPVNLLRFHFLNLIKNGKKVTSKIVDETKKAFIDKDLDYFENYEEGVLEQINKYPKDNPFKSWKKDFSILHPFFYSRNTDSSVRKNLEKIANNLLEELNLAKYKTHIVDFSGAQEYGYSHCWIALFPTILVDHKDAYQFFVKIKSNSFVAGIKSGSRINKKKKVEDIKHFKNWDDVVNKLKSSIEKVKNLNTKLIDISSTKVKHQEKRENQNYWWLNANPKIWTIKSFKVGDVQSYTSYNEKGNKRRIYKYFEEVKKGDLVIGYESTPVKQIKAIFEIDKGLHNDKNEGEIIKFKIVEFLDTPIHWDDLKVAKGLENCEPLNNNQGSLFKLRAEEFEIIRDIIDEKEIETSAIKAVDYSIETDPEKPFLLEEEIEKIVDSLKVKKNIALQGPPGVGKTFIAKKIAYELMGKKDDHKIEMIQFHQSYSYEDFVQGIRPSGKEFVVKNGVFYNFCKKAASDSKHKYFFIIDEINRGNLSKIFGELMLLIEADKRKEDYAVELTYSESERFYIPENVYLIGTMNTADRSLAIVDYALRRRFRFISLKPQFTSDLFQNHLTNLGVSDSFVKNIVERLTSLNLRIQEDDNLGAGFLIGHSFFCNFKNENTDEKKWFQDIIDFEIKPLLEEYWFDNVDKVKKTLAKLNLE